MADASCSATSLLLAHLPLIHGTATKVPHLSLFTSHPRYSVAVLLTSPLVSTTISKRHRESGAVCLWRRSRLGSELARDISPMRVASLFFLAHKRAIYPCAQVRRLAEQDAFALPRRPWRVGASLTNAPPLRCPALMAKLPSSPPQKALAMQVLFSFERGVSHPWLTRVARRHLFSSHISLRGI